MGRCVGNTFDTATALRTPTALNQPSSQTNCDTLRHDDTHLAGLHDHHETPQTQQEAHKPTYLLLAKNIWCTMAAGDAQPYPARPSGPRAQPTTKPALMASGFRMREGAGLCCSLDNVPAGTATPAWTWTCHATCRWWGGGGLRQRPRRTHAAELSRRRPPACRPEPATS